MPNRVQAPADAKPTASTRPARAVSKAGVLASASFSQALESARQTPSSARSEASTGITAAALAGWEQAPTSGLAAFRRRLSGPLKSVRDLSVRPDRPAAQAFRTGNGLARADEMDNLTAPQLRPSGQAAATGSAHPSPLRLADYPRPTSDNGRGLHWIPTLGSSQEVADRFVREAVEMKAKWVVFLNEDTKVGANDYLVKQLVGRGIMPILRIYTPGGAPIQGDVKALVRHYQPLGVQYYQIYNEPNLRVENGGAAPDPKRFVDYWLPAAKAVAEAGGLPGFAPLAPGGDYDDLVFLREALGAIKARGETAVLDRAWIGLHNYTLNHPIEYTKDSNGFLKFRWYDRIVRQQLGRSLPIVGTEGGTWVGQQEDKTLPPVTEGRQVEMAVDAYKYMRRAEPYYFAYTYWVLANELGGGNDPAWRDHALFRPDRTSPVVSALKALA